MLGISLAKLLKSKDAKLLESPVAMKNVLGWKKSSVLIMQSIIKLKLSDALNILMIIHIFIRIFFEHIIDCYIDNVGGELSSIVINEMREFGRIAVCGSVSPYDFPISKWSLVPILQPTFIFKQLTMKRFLVTQYQDKWSDGISQLKQWTEEGRLKNRETITNGFENTPQAFVDVLQDKNMGKTLVKI